jgi:hypothetical protein
MTKRATSHHDRGQLFGTDGSGWWIEPDLWADDGDYDRPCSRCPAIGIREVLGELLCWSHIAQVGREAVR